MHTCISSHGLKRSWRSCPRRANAGNKNTPSTHHPRRQNVTTLMVGLKNGHIRKNLTQKVVNPRDIAGERKKKNNKKKNCTVNRLQHVRQVVRLQSYANPVQHRVIECLLRATCRVMCHVVRRDSSASKFDRVEIAFIWALFYWLIIIIIIIAFKGAIRDFLQSPHSAVNCLQHIRSSGPGATVCKSRATLRALITCKCHVTCHLVRRDSSAIKFDRFEIAFIWGLFYWLTH